MPASTPRTSARLAEQALGTVDVNPTPTVIPPTSNSTIGANPHTERPVNPLGQESTAPLVGYSLDTRPQESRRGGVEMLSRGTHLPNAAPFATYPTVAPAGPPYYGGPGVTRGVHDSMETMATESSAARRRRGNLGEDPDLYSQQQFQPRKLTNTKLLCITSYERRTADIAKWFEDFMSELSDGYIPMNRWVDYLRQNVEAETKLKIVGYITRLREQGVDLQDGREALNLICDAIMMTFLVAHHPGAYACRYFYNNYKNKVHPIPATDALAEIITMRTRFNEAAERLRINGCPAYELDEITATLFYLTALNDDTAQALRTRIPEILRNPNPLETLGFMAAGVEKEAVWQLPYDPNEPSKVRKHGGVSVGFVRSGAPSREPTRRPNTPPQKFTRNWSINEQEKCLHCGLKGHTESTCRRWERVKDTYPKGTCAKCLRRGHDSIACREAVGILWNIFHSDRTAKPQGVGHIVAYVQTNPPAPEEIEKFQKNKKTSKRRRDRISASRKGRDNRRKDEVQVMVANHAQPDQNPNTLPIGIGAIPYGPDGREFDSPHQHGQIRPSFAGSPYPGPQVVGTIFESSSPNFRKQDEACKAKNGKVPEINEKFDENSQRRVILNNANCYLPDIQDYDVDDPYLAGELVATVYSKNSENGPTLKFGQNTRTIVVKLKFEGKEYRAVCDTGCPVTLIKQEIADRWEANGPFATAKSHINFLTDVNGRELKYNRTIEMIMEVRGTHRLFKNTQQRFNLGVVAWLPVDFLLGMDVIKLMRFNIDMSQWDILPGNFLSARDITMFQSPIKEIRLYRFVPERIVEGHEGRRGDLGNHTKYERTMMVEDLSTTCMTVSNWSRTIGRDQKDKDLILRKGSEWELTKIKDKPLKVRSLASYEALKLAVYHNHPTTWSEDHRKIFFQLCLDFPAIWNSGDLPLASTSLTVCHLELEGNPKPIKAVVRPMSETKKNITRGKVAEMIKEGIITTSTSTWASPVVLVPKANEEWRLCIDYRELNNVLKVTSWPLPRMHQVSDRMQGVRYVCALDLLQGYYQIELTKESRHITAFQTTEGLYEYTRLPFGLAVAPAVFQRFVDELLGDMRPYKVEAYLDDFLLKGETWEIFLKNARELFQRCQESKVQFKPQKCDMGLKELAFLGYLISTEGVRPIPLKTLPVQMYDVPTTRKKLKTFLGMAGYYRKFVRDYALKAAILHELDHNDVTFTWTPAHNDAFELLKRNICEATMLSHPDYTREFIVDTDASNIGLGAVLSQLHNDKVEKPISFASRKLTGAEVKWGATELEAFAVVWALEIFRPWIDGYQVLVRTDHSPLLWLQKNVNKTPKLARWVLRLQEFTFQLQHRPGKAQVVADALSRTPLKQLPNDKFEFDAVEKGINMFSDVVVGEKVMKINERKRKRNQGKKVNEIEESPIWVDPALISNQHSKEIKPFSTKRLKEEMEYCPICQWANQKIDNPELPNTNWLKKINGTLTRDEEGRIWVVTVTPKLAAAPPGTKRLLIPTGMVQGIMQRTHGGHYGGHFGYYKTLLKIKGKFYWPSLKTDVRRFIMACALCWSVARNPEGRLRPKAMLPTGSPGEVIAMDFFGPLPITNRKNRFILVIIDHFTRWVLVEPLRDAKAYSVTKTIIDRWIPTHGLPRIILSDNGPHFRSKTTTQLCEKLGIRNIFSTPYHPQGNGIVEAFMRPLKKILSVQVSQVGNHWDLCCSAAGYAYNSTPHSTTGRSPFYLMHGFEAFLPIQRELEMPSEPRQSDVWIRALWDARRRVFGDYIAEQRRRSTLVKGTGFPVNSMVALRQPENDKDDEFGKLGALMSGPWKVIERHENGVTHKVESPDTGVTRQVTTGQMKLIELPITNSSMDKNGIPMEEVVINNLPLAELDTRPQDNIEPKPVPQATEIHGRVLRNTDARRANASLAKQQANERTVII